MPCFQRYRVCKEGRIIRPYTANYDKVNFVILNFIRTVHCTGHNQMGSKMDMS